VGKGEASLFLPVVATALIPCIYHGASFSHGRPRQNCLVLRNTASLASIGVRNGSELFSLRSQIVLPPFHVPFHV